MARRVFFHVGTLKTGTTYLQRLMWENRDQLRDAGILFAGEHYNDRVWAAQTVRQLSQPHERASTSWERMVAQINAFDGDAIVSHEFLGSASAEQAAEAKARVAPAEIHVVATARDLIGILPALWQERVKFGFTGRFERFEPKPLSAPPSNHWSWRAIDVADVLRRWAVDVPPERVHVVTFPPEGSPRDLLWKRFSEACGFDASVASLDLPAVNESMGVAEAELLRRINKGLHPDLQPPAERARWLRTYVGLGILARRDGEKLRVGPERAAQLRERGRGIVEDLRRAGYTVVGDLEDLVGPESPQSSRQPSKVPPVELLDVAVDLVNQMLVDQRLMSLENARLRGEINALHQARRGLGVRRAAGSIVRGLVRRGGRGSHDEPGVGMASDDEAIASGR